MLRRLFAVALTAPMALDAQAADTTQRASRAGRRTPLPVEREIALARSAAPASISGAARVLMMVDTGYITVAEGTSGVTCVVNRSWDKSLEPHCYDPEGSATVMWIELRRELLRHQGKSETEIAGRLGEALLDGTLKLPSKPALTYMMSAGQVLYDDAGKYVGRWRPHLMIYYPNLSNAGMGLPQRPEMAVGMVSNDGEAESSLMIVMPKFVEIVPAPPRP